MPDNLQDNITATLGEIDELAFHRAVLDVAQHLNKRKIPKSKGDIAVAMFDMLNERKEDDEEELTAECRKNRFDFIKTIVPKAAEAIRKAKLGQTTEEEILHEKKAIAELKVVLRELVDEQKGPEDRDDARDRQWGPAPQQN